MIRRPPRSTLFPSRRSSDLQCKWLAMVKGETPRVERKVDSIVDVVRETLARVKAGEPVDAKTLEPLVKKRKLVREEKWKEYELTKGPEFALERKVLPADLTKEMMKEGDRKSTRSELQSHSDLVCRLLLEKKKKNKNKPHLNSYHTVM